MKKRLLILFLFSFISAFAQETFEEVEAVGMVVDNFNKDLAKIDAIKKAKLACDREVERISEWKLWEVNRGFWYEDYASAKFKCLNNQSEEI